MMKPNRRRRDKPRPGGPSPGPRPDAPRRGRPLKPRGKPGSDEAPRVKEHPQYGTRIPPEELEFMRQQAAERAREERERRGFGPTRSHGPKPYTPRSGGYGGRPSGPPTRGPGGFRGERDRYPGPPRERHGQGPAPYRDRGPGAGRPERGPMPPRPGRDRGRAAPYRERPPAKPYRTGVQSAGEGPPRPSPAPAEPPLHKVRRLLSAYQQTAVVMAAHSLGVFGEIHRRPQVAGDIARHCASDPRGMEALLEALVALGILDRHGSSYVLPRDLAPYFVPGESGDATGMVEWAPDLYHAWGDLARGVREGTPRFPLGSDAILAGDPGRVRRYIRAVHTVSREAARRIVELAPILPGSSLLDVAGGSGVYAAEYARRIPDVKAHLFDLPPTLEVAREILLAEGYEDNVEFHPGDYRTDPFPGPVDTLLLSNMVQTESEEHVRGVFRKAWDALRPGGTLLVHGMMTDAEAPPAPETALFTLLMFTVFDHGRAWSVAQVSDWLAQERFGVRATRELGPPFKSKLILASRLE